MSSFIRRSPQFFRIIYYNYRNHSNNIPRRYIAEPAQVRTQTQSHSSLSNQDPLIVPDIGHRSYRIPHRQSTRWRFGTDMLPKSTSSYQQKARKMASDTRSARLLLSYHDLERALERRGLNTVRVLLAGAGIAVVVVGLAWPSIKQWGAVEGAEVAAASLEHEQLQLKASAMLHEVLADPKTGEQVEKLLKVTVLNLFQDEEFTDKAVEWTTNVLSDALTWESLRKQGTDYLVSVFQDEESQQSAKEYLSDAVQTIVKDQAVQDTVASGIWSGVRASIMGRRTPKQENTAASASATVTTSTVSDATAGIVSGSLDESHEKVNSSSVAQVRSTLEKKDD